MSLIIYQDKKLFFNFTEGLVIQSNYLSNDQIGHLFHNVDLYKWESGLMARRVQHYGYAYNYLSKSVNKITDDIPDYFKPILDQLLKDGLITKMPNQLIINEYTNGTNRFLCRGFY